MNEIELFKNTRPDVAPYASTAKAAARQRLLAQAGPPASEFRWRRVCMVGVAASSVLAVGAAVMHIQIATEPPQATVLTAPALTTMSVTEVLGRAASAVDDELTPRDDQFVVVESQAMYQASEFGPDGEKRWFDHTHRTIWQSADGNKEGVIRVETQRPTEQPGWPIPPMAYEWMRTELSPLGRCVLPENERTDYASLRKLPADRDGMRRHLYDRAAAPGATADDLAWERAGTLLRETYLPPAQRAALFQAIATIDGVSVVDGVEDAAGRTGIGVGRVDFSFRTRTDLIFDRETYQLLGERGVSVDAERWGPPVGRLVASTAQLEVSVSDVAPEVGPVEVPIACL
jgi:hypothetical protein